MRLETRYARSGDVSIAYQVLGDGPLDLVYVSGWVSNIDVGWDQPRYARFKSRLASFSRLIIFDKRGTGLSDRSVDLPTLEQRMDDVRAVMDAVGSERAALLGISEGAPMCALFAATYPERTAALLMFGGYARRLWAPDHPWGVKREDRDRFIEMVEQGWGGPVALEVRAPSHVNDEGFRTWFATYLRMSASPGAVVALTRMNDEIDVRPALPVIRVPTLVMHRTGDRSVAVGDGRYLAQQIPGARYIEYEGDDHLPYAGDMETVLDDIEFFLTGIRPQFEPDRVLATILVMEVVAASEAAARRGAERWQATLDALRVGVAAELVRHRGREVRTTGTGIVAAFDGPARAIRCGGAMIEAARQLGLQARIGLHTGECDVSGDDIGGVAVEIAARVASLAVPDEQLVSNTVRDLVAGSGIRFEEVGNRPFRGLPADSRLFRVERGQESPRGPTAQVGAGAAATDRHQMTLSPQERKIASLLTLGLTTHQIGDELGIADGTVNRHVANICNKLGYRSRAQIAAWATAHGLAGRSTD
jgi:class 3 adenylate cyclase/DNA-binding CsgD family transcriptional regulator